MSRAGRVLLGWSAERLATESGVAVITVRRFEAGKVVRPAGVQAMRQALEAGGLEFIQAGGRSLRGGEGVRVIPKPTPEVAAAQEAVELVLDEGEALRELGAA